MPDIAVRSVTLKNGRATFNDRFVRPNYTAELSAIEGSVSAVSSTDPKPAKVSVNGRVYRTAPLAISGIVQPFAKFLTLDIKASARGVDLPRFTTLFVQIRGLPHRARQALDGCGTTRIKDRQLQASNRVQLDQLTFGPKTDSPQATTLPVMLAVALLKDRSGNIDINLPISGSLDDPSFSVGGHHPAGHRQSDRQGGHLALQPAGVGLRRRRRAFLHHLRARQHGTDRRRQGEAEEKAGQRAGRPPVAEDGYRRPRGSGDRRGRPAPGLGGHRASASQRSRATGKSGRLDGDAPLSDAERAKYLEAAYDDTQDRQQTAQFHRHGQVRAAGADGSAC